MKTKINLRLVAFAIALLMVLQLVPASFLHVTAADADTTHVLNASEMTAFDKGVKADYETEVINDYFTMHYSKNSRVDESNKTFSDGWSGTQRLTLGGKSKSESKGIKNLIEFTTDSATTVTVWWVSGGADRYVAIWDASFAEIAASEAATASNELFISAMSLEAAGTYYLALPVDNNYLFKVEVAPAASEPDESTEETTDETTGSDVETEEVTHTFEASTLTAAADKEEVAEGTTFADGYFTSFGTLTKRTKNDAVYCVELGKKNASGLTFETTGTANVSVWISSTGGSNESTFNLLDAEGNAIADSTGNTTPAVTGTSYIEVTYTNLPAGVYKIASPSTARNARLQKVVVVENVPVSGGDQGGEEEAPATSWDFTSDEYTGQTSYHGLTITGNPAKHDSTYGMRIKGGTISVPVSGACEIHVAVGYNWDITFPDGTTATHENSASPVVYKHTGEAGTVEITVGTSCTSYIAKIELAELPEEEPEEAPEYTSDKIYVWDFGAEQLDPSKYNNMLTVDEINSWFEGVEPGTTGKNLASFTASNGLLSFNDGGYPTTHRLRSTNSALTRYDDKSLKDADGNVYTGYIYSNKSEPGVYLTLKATAGDIVTLVVGSNAKADSVIAFEAPSGAVSEKTHLLDGAKAQLLTFYATETGTYKIYCNTAAEKLVLARIYLEHNDTATVSGKVTAPESLTGYSLVFTNTASGAVTTAKVENGSYSVVLTDNYSYEVSLADANGYIITGTKTLTIAKGAGSASLDLNIAAVTIATVSGNITGLSADALANLKLSLIGGGIYIPEIIISGTTYTVNVEVGMEYTLVAEGVNDFALTSSATWKYDANTTADITFAAKPTYAVTIVPDGCTLADLAGATFTFTNLKEEGYVYTFTGPDAIVLRDGTYDVKVTNIGGYVQKLTSNLTVNGAATSKTIGFEVPLKWDFRTEEYTGQAAFNGLTMTGSFSKHSANYGMAIKNGTVTIPVPGSCNIHISVGYTWDITLPDGTNHLNTSDSNAVLVYSHSGAAGSVVLTIGEGATTYIRSIEIIPAVAYKETVTVGATGCDYTTINDALSAIRAMDRTAEQRVTILIQPGNYEEMLVIDVPNVTLKNASSNPSIALTDKGVGIDANAVRITWYYGHGYNYFSMGSDYKFNADVLKVNQENGYISTENPGSGTGTYWNASVVIAANGFRAEGIIFENSFNQYVSAAAAKDTIIARADAKEGSTPRSELTAGSTAVQDKKYVERAAALAIVDGCTEVYFENCKFVGRQDTLYGGKGATVAFYDCSVYGSTDYIFGGMTAVFAKCDLVFNTSENSNDVGYITAAQTAAGSHGILLYNCTITSTTPGVDTASEYPSKPGYFGRPWTANSGEAVFFNTVIDATCNHWFSISPSLIRADGWLSTLSGESPLCGEFGTYEYAKDVDHSANRVSWATVFQTATLASGEPISVETWFGSWDAFAGKDMTIVIPTEKVDNSTAPDEGGDNDDPSGGDTSGYVEQTIVLDATKDLSLFIAGTKAQGETMLIKDFFTIIFSEKTKVDSSNKTFSDGFSGSQRLNFQAATGEDMSCSVKFTTPTAAKVMIWWVSGGDGRTFAIYNEAGEIITRTTEESIKNELYISTLELDAAGTYYLGVPEGSNNLFKLEVTILVPGEDEGGDEPTEPSEPSQGDVHVMDTTDDLDNFAAGEKADGDTLQINDYFTIHFSAKSKVEAKTKAFPDGYIGSKRLSLGGATDVALGMLNSVEFTADGATAVKIWWVGGGEGRYVAIYDAKGNIIASTEVCAEKDDLHVSELIVPAAGTYYIGNPEGNNYLFRIEAAATDISVVPDTGDTGISLAVVLLLISATTVAILPRKKFF